jgi:type II secretory pathway component GspD/PulD (secretin)
LRDIPWIGWLFGGSSVRNETVQRMFILTPYIIDVTTNDVLSVQADRQRDVEREEVLEEELDKDGIERKEREAQIEFRREIRQDRAEERRSRNEEMRDLSREKRQKEMKEDRKTWEKWFKEEKLRYEKSKETDVD